MPDLSLGPQLIDRLLLGPRADGRMVQDSPIRGDVLAAFASNPRGRLDLLITPYKSQPASGLAAYLSRAAREDEEPRVSFLEGVVVARLTLARVLESVLPATGWFRTLCEEEIVSADLAYAIARNIALMREEEAQGTLPMASDGENLPFAVRRAAVFFTLLGAVQALGNVIETGQPPRTLNTVEEIVEFVSLEALTEAGAGIFRRLTKTCPAMVDPIIFAVSLNRPVEMAVNRSALTVKADSARLLFAVDCSEITWAILDSGIDSEHPAFADHASPSGTSRVIATFDFSRLRDLISTDYLFNSKALSEAAKTFASARTEEAVGAAKADLKLLAEEAERGRPVNWGLARRYIEVASPASPDVAHGTHVAGILAADWREPDVNDPAKTKQRLTGVCPDIRLMDFRVVGATEADTEFNVIAAMQFIRFLNTQNNYQIVHGANLSLSIPHSVRNYACGATPVCEEAERLVSSGVFVVAAAGNRGYQNYQLSGGGSFDSYAPSSITDPGNAEAVLTVGATHRTSPHNYGVSFFSSRGPTGDGRAKPDLLAPGEKILSAIPGGKEGADDTRDGTSMAAPHASGAAALLMARNSEFIGRPGKIKRVLMDSCTDLGRERSFQGAGLIDVLRAMQTI